MSDWSRQGQKSDGMIACKGIRAIVNDENKQGGFSCSFGLSVARRELKLKDIWPYN
jgi:hypothetical protein